jgi:hypothetical protein
MLEYYDRFMNKKITSVIMVVAIVIAVAAAAISINGYNSAYAVSGNSGGSYNAGNTHLQCSAGASFNPDPKCHTLTDSGKHKGLSP